ncbi:MAG: Na+/H+ antiporter subunit E [Pseudomonadota bacterium]
MFRSISLCVVLFIFWMALSGYYDNLFLVTVGAASTLGCVLIGRCMGTTDVEGHPVYLVPAVIFYYPWLLIEIVKSAWAVTKIIIDPQLPISPTMAHIRASQKTSVGIATYANSITLTPGTLTVKVTDQDLTVHALVREGVDDLEKGVMDAKVTAFEGAS